MFASGSKLSVLTNPIAGTTYCIKTNTSSNTPAAPPAGCTQTTSASYDTEDLWIGCSFSAFDSETCDLDIDIFADNAAFTTNGGNAGPTPTPGPTTEPTIPPNYWGPNNATPPPNQSDVDVNVDICDDDPTIIACLHSFPPMTVDMCTSTPDIAACATPGPLPSPASGGGDGAPGNSPVPNGLAECLVASHPPKPGTIPLEPLATAPIPQGIDLGAYAAWIGTNVSNVPRVAANAVAGANNTVIDYVIPGECLGVMMDDFADDVTGTPPFSYFFDARAALAEGASEESIVAFEPVEIGGATIDLAPVFISVGNMLEPYGSVLRLIPWAIIVILILRHVAGTVGAGKGGG